MVYKQAMGFITIVTKAYRSAMNSHRRILVFDLHKLIYEHVHVHENANNLGSDQV